MRDAKAPIVNLDLPLEFLLVMRDPAAERVVDSSVGKVGPARAYA